MNRHRAVTIVIIGAVAVALGWGLMAGLSRVLRDTSGAAPTADAPPPQTTPAPQPAVPKIKATLFFGSEDGRSLVPVEQEIPMAEGKVAQARAVVEAQLTMVPPEPPSHDSASIPGGTNSWLYLRRIP